MNKNIYQLKITLDDSKPKVWRQIVVPKEYTFFDLHVAIQDAFGWTDSHLHAFHIVEKGTSRPITIQFPDPENDFDEDFLDERKEKITDYLGASIKQCKYTYDFGDSWDHTILLEKEISVEQAALKTYPRCIAGKNACPPEDCGGVWGYEHLQDTLKDPKSEDYEDMLEWLGIEEGNQFDPHHFDPTEVVFEDPKKRLKEYEKGFGVKPLKR